MSERILPRAVVISFVCVCLWGLGFKQQAAANNFFENLSMSHLNANEFSETGFSIHESNQSNPSGQDDKKAEEVYKNIQILKGIPASRVMGAMGFFARSLGVKCDHCHVQGQNEKDEKPAKLAARKMYALVRFAQEKGAKNASCFMCHAGQVKPEPAPFLAKENMDALMAEAEKDKRPAEQAFKNIQIFKGVTAGRVKMTMQLFTKSLGVQCSHCHVQGDFSKDDNPAKQTARGMLTMAGGIAKDFFNGQMTITCYTCHKGQAKPVAFPPQRQGN
ncbi:MAG: c-type cytochrome [Acidobacteriota bacterium]